MPDRRRFIAVGLWTMFSTSAPLTLHATESARTSSPSSTSASAESARTPSLSSTSVSASASKPGGHDTGKILVIGDSLSAEYGLPTGSGWVAAIAERLHQHATGYQIYNSSISGDTTSGGLARLPAELERVEPDIVIIELGSNDALRGLPLDLARDNLSEMILASQDIKAHVVLLGMQIPPNYGPRYAEQFASLFPELAKTYQTTLVPFLLEGFAADPSMFLDDGIHPNEAAQSVMADTVWEYLAPLVVRDK